MAGCGDGCFAAGRALANRDQVQRTAMASTRACPVQEVQVPKDLLAKEDVIQTMPQDQKPCKPPSNIHEQCHEKLKEKKQRGCIEEFRYCLGRFLESPWFHACMLILISVELVVDLFELAIGFGLCFNTGESAKMHRHVRNQYDYEVFSNFAMCESGDGPRGRLMLEILDDFSEWLCLVFLAEVFLKIFVGHAHFVKNKWNILDMMIIVITAAVEFEIADHLLEDSVEEWLGLTRVVRYWRLVKLARILFKEEVEGRDLYARWSNIPEQSKKHK